MCSIFQLHEQQMHLKKIDIVHPASKVFAVGDEGHNLSELKKKKLFVSWKVSLQELLTGAPLELFPLKSANGSELTIFNICQFILGFPNMIKSICICTFFNIAFTCICPGAGHL